MSSLTPSDDPVITDLKLNGGQREIYETVKRFGDAGINSDRLFNLLYADDPNGGPLTGKKTLTTRIYLLNRKLRRHKLEIRSGIGAGNNIYRLQQIDRKQKRARNGRFANNPMWKLTPTQVTSLTKEYLDSWEPGAKAISQRKIAKKYGIDQSYVSRLIHRDECQ